MISYCDDYATPGYYSLDVAADARRKEFNIKNHSVLRSGKQPDFIFIGDSITHFWELNAYFSRPEQLILNRGIAGDNTSYLRKRFFADALQLHPRYIIMGIGINDSIDLEGDYWKLISPKPYDDVLARAKENIMDIIQQTKTAQTTLVLASLLPIRMPISLHEAERKQFVLDMNQWLAETARKEDLIFVNYFIATIYPGSNKLLDNITYDGLHPNGRGYELMSQVLRSTLSRNGILI